MASNPSNREKIAPWPRWSSASRPTPWCPAQNSDFSMNQRKSRFIKFIKVRKLPSWMPRNSNFGYVSNCFDISWCFNISTAASRFSLQTISKVLVPCSFLWPSWQALLPRHWCCPSACLPQITNARSHFEHRTSSNPPKEPLPPPRHTKTIQDLHGFLTKSLSISCNFRMNSASCAACRETWAMDSMDSWKFLENDAT